MRRWRQRLTQWLGRACGVVAVVMMGAWLFFPRLGNFVAASPSGQWGLMVSTGRIEVVRSPVPALLLIKVRFREQYNGLFECDESGFNEAKLKAQAARLLDPSVIELANVGWEDIPAQFSLSASEQRLYPWLTNYAFSHGITVPLWCIALALAAVAWMTESRRRCCTKREGMGHCTKCNYNRTGLAKDTLCPECGTKP